MTDADIHDNPESHRYELPVGTKVSVIIRFWPERL